MVKDDGLDRTVFDSGAVRELDGLHKGRYDLLPVFATRALAKYYAECLRKYPERNWEKGIPYSSCIDSAKRHLDKYIMRMYDEDHLVAAIWNLLCILEFRERGMGDKLDNMPRYDKDRKGAKEENAE